jgi:hypothetical protein
LEIFENFFFFLINYFVICFLITTMAMGRGRQYHIFFDIISYQYHGQKNDILSSAYHYFLNNIISYQYHFTKMWIVNSSFNIDFLSLKNWGSKSVSQIGVINEPNRGPKSGSPIDFVTHSQKKWYDILILIYYQLISRPQKVIL